MQKSTDEKHKPMKKLNRNRNKRKNAINEKNMINENV